MKLKGNIKLFAAINYQAYFVKSKQLAFLTQNLPNSEKVESLEIFMTDFL
jgi:hypothetical protein